MFTGPTGMAIARPASTPRSSSSSSFINPYIMKDVRRYRASELPSVSGTLARSSASSATRSPIAA